MQEIAQAAGLTRGAIYWHFQNKADLFDAMMQRVVLPLEHALNAGRRAGGGGSAGRVCARASTTCWRKLVHDPQVRRVFEIATLKVEYAGDLQVLRERRVASREACMDDLERLFDTGRGKGPDRRRNCRRAWRRAACAPWSTA